MLPGTAAPAISGAQGFDSDSAIMATAAKALYAAGFRFAVRYLSRSSPQSSADLSLAEADAILGAGLALMPVQHVARPGWAPSAALGQQYGKAAAQNALLLEFPPGVTVWLDLEGVASYAAAADAIAYCNAWAAAVALEGYDPGLYVGANQPLSGDDLYWRLRVARYWKSASTVPAIPYRGYCMVQALAPSPVAGVAVDRNVIMADQFGGLPIWVRPTS